MNPATEVLKEIDNLNTEPTLAEQTYDALKPQKDGVLLGEHVA